MNKIRCTLFTLYLSSMFFYGVLIKSLYHTSLIGIVKFIPEFFLILFLLSIISFKRINKADKKDIILTSLIISIYVISLFNADSYNSVLIAIRDFLLPFLAFLIIKKSDLKRCNIRDLYKCFVVVGIVFLLLSLYFGYLQHTNGYEYTAKFYTGKVFYGKDDIASITIKTSGGFVRALGLTGNDAKYGFYTLIAFIIINTFYKEKWILNTTFVATLLNCYFSTSKTTIVLCAFVYLYIYANTFGKLAKKIVLPILLLISVFFVSSVLSNLDEYYSIAERFERWGSQQYFDMSNIFIGTNLYSYFNGGWNSILDNAYLFGSCAFGLIGYLCILIYIIKKSFKVSLISRTFLLVFLIGSLTVNMFSARSYIGLFFIVLGLENRLRILGINNAVGRIR